MDNPWLKWPSAKLIGSLMHCCFSLPFSAQAEMRNCLKLPTGLLFLRAQKDHRVCDICWDNFGQIHPARLGWRAEEMIYSANFSGYRTPLRIICEFTQLCLSSLKQDAGWAMRLSCWNVSLLWTLATSPPNMGKNRTHLTLLGLQCLLTAYFVYLLFFVFKEEG